jgi:hypothetical protein
MIRRHTGRSKLIDGDPIATDLLELRHDLERRNYMFLVRLRAALMDHSETLEASVG